MYFLYTYGSTEVRKYFRTLESTSGSMIRPYGNRYFDHYKYKRVVPSKIFYLATVNNLEV